MPKQKSLRVVEVVGSLDRNWGGLSLYVAELADGLAAQGHNVQVACKTKTSAVCWPVRQTNVTHAKSGSQVLDAMLDAADVVHVHGLWLPFYHQALAGARRRNKPCVLSVHGMLEPGALGFARWKKRLALLLYQMKDLQTANVLHATAAPERETLRTFGLRQPIVVLPPGVGLPAHQPPPVQTVRSALFLGRIHPKKGILNLIEAWAAVRPSGWRLEIAGPDEDGHLAEVRRLLKSRGLEQQVAYHGAVFGEAKEKLLRSASLFIAPSISENFGIVIAEALAYGVPVITTTGTPWKIVVQERCGWWVPFGSSPLAAAVREATALSPAHLVEMGKRGRSLVERDYHWPKIAGQMAEVYSWLAGAASMPSCVKLA